jgi:uncharacterized protein
MIDGLAVVDAHMHVPRLSTVTKAWLDWAAAFGKDSGWREVFGADGDPIPARVEAMLDAEGVDVALLFAEYSPRATGIQPVEDLLPIIARNPARFRLVANVNPELHRPPAAEAERQLDLGAVAVKVHSVHGGFRADTPDMYAVYDLCARRKVPVITHTGGSIFPGSQPEAGDPKLMGQIVRDFPGVTFVLAHGGRGRWYADAARLALSHRNVWLDLAGLPPKRLRDCWRASGSSAPTGRGCRAWHATPARWRPSACPPTCWPGSWPATRPRCTPCPRHPGSPGNPRRARPGCRPPPRGRGTAAAAAAPPRRCPGRG